MVGRFKFGEDSGPRVPQVKRQALVDLLDYNNHVVVKVKQTFKEVRSTEPDVLTMADIKDTLLVLLQSQATLLSAQGALLQHKINMKDTQGD